MHAKAVQNLFMCFQGNVDVLSTSNISIFQYQEN